MDNQDNQVNQTPDTEHQHIAPKTLHIIIGVIVAIFVAKLITLAVVVYNHDHGKTNTNTSYPAPVTASITPSGFSPLTLTIKVGQDVTWVNYDTKSHDVASDPYPKDNSLSGFKSSLLNQSQSYSFVFDQKGTFTYHDDLNPTTFRGTVIVK